MISVPAPARSSQNPHDARASDPLRRSLPVGPAGSKKRIVHYSALFRPDLAIPPTEISARHQLPATSTPVDRCRAGRSAVLTDALKGPRRSSALVSGDGLRRGEEAVRNLLLCRTRLNWAAHLVRHLPAYVCMLCGHQGTVEGIQQDEAEDSSLASRFRHPRTMRTVFVVLPWCEVAAAADCWMDWCLTPEC